MVLLFPLTLYAHCQKLKKITVSHDREWDKADPNTASIQNVFVVFTISLASSPCCACRLSDRQMNHVSSVIKALNTLLNFHKLICLNFKLCLNFLRKLDCSILSSHTYLAFFSICLIHCLNHSSSTGQN